MVGIVQLVRMPDCGSGGHGFEFHYPPQQKSTFVEKQMCFFERCLLFKQVT